MDVFIVNFEQISDLFLVFFIIDFVKVNVSWEYRRTHPGKFAKEKLLLDKN